MDVLRNAADLKAWRQQARGDGVDVAFVPTMGALHHGHQALMRAACQSGGRLIVSIFVNPRQFGPGEDFEAYPRDEVADLAKVAEVDPEAAVFLPGVDDIYPPRFKTSVTVSGLTAPLCGRSRPGHFDGVTTVVARLLGLVSPTRAYFGQKDYQQLAVIRRLVGDLALGVEVVGVPTVREADGLALSSRNIYLKPPEREAALALSRGLGWARAAWEAGERGAEALVAEVRRALSAETLVQEDYVEALDAEDLSPLRPGRPAVVAVAAYVGRARLIDNTVLSP